MSDEQATRAGAGLMLDARQRAMLAEMGIRVWTPKVPHAPVDATADVTAAIATAAIATAPRPVSPPPSVPVAMPEPVSARAPVPADPQPAPMRDDVAALDWDALQQAMRACQACGLCERRTQAVPGVGDAQRPDWLVVGEAPGEQEDQQGEPFVGPAGQLLDRMLQAMGLARGRSVYITNVVKCRPPHNRNPEPAEIAQCTPFLQRQIALLRPRIVLAVGRFAAQTVLGLAGVDEATRQLPLGKLRGQVFALPLPGGPVPVVVSYHPAYLLRSPAEKAKAWADLCLAMDSLEAKAQADTTSSSG